jgi:multidrug efflux pump subunit AcrA (membrane-fusion protein)
MLLLSLAILLSAGCNKAEDEPGGPAVETFDLSVAAAQLHEVPGTLELSGTVEGRHVIPIATKLMGTVTFMGYEEGQRVGAGDVLARIDDGEIQAMRAEAAAYRAEAVAAQSEVQAAVAQGDAARDEAEAALAQAEAALDEARKDAERARRLADEETIPRVDADKAELALKVAEENVSRAASGVNQAEAGIAQAEARLPQIDAKIQQAAAKDSQAKEMQDYATLTAPFAGVVTSRLAEPGQLAAPGQPLYMFADDSSFRVIVNVAENLSRSLHVGQQLGVTLEDPAGTEDAEVVTGEIASISAAADPRAHTIRVEIALPAQDGVFAGRFVRVEVPSGSRQEITIPEGALVREGEVTFVWRVSPGGTVTRIPVEVSGIAGGRATIARGLADGDRVVSAPDSALFPGAKVAGGELAGAMPDAESGHE